MDELIEIMSDLLDEIREMNCKLDNIKSEVESIKGTGIYDSLADVCDKIDSLETTITLGSNY